MNARVAVLALAVVLAGCGQAGGEAPGDAPVAPGDEPVAGGPSAGAGVPGRRGSGAVLCKGPDRPAAGAPAGTDCSVPDGRIRGRLTKPRPGMAAVRPVPFESARASGRRLVVSWWSGVEPCAVLDHVEVKETPRRVVVTLYEGRDPAAGRDAVCIEIAEARSTTVRLARPLGDRTVVDGARGRLR